MFAPETLPWSARVDRRRDVTRLSALSSTTDAPFARFDFTITGRAALDHDLLALERSRAGSSTVVLPGRHVELCASRARDRSISSATAPSRHVLDHELCPSSSVNTHHAGRLHRDLRGGDRPSPVTGSTTLPRSVRVAGGGGGAGRLRPSMIDDRRPCRRPPRPSPAAWPGASTSSVTSPAATPASVNVPSAAVVVASSRAVDRDRRAGDRRAVRVGHDAADRAASASAAAAPGGPRYLELTARCARRSRRSAAR